MPAHEKLGAQFDFATMSKEDYEASAGEGRRWVYHASSSPDVFAEGVRMENVPRNLARMRFEAGEYAEFAPGAGLGRGTYVGGEAHHVSGYGRFLHALSVPTSHLAVPPEANDYKPDDVEYHLNRDTVGALVTKDVEPEHVVPMGRIRTSSMTGHETHQLNAIREGREIPDEVLSPKVKEHVRFNKERGWEI